MLWAQRYDPGEVTQIRVNSLLPADSPRSREESSAHVKVLAEVATPLPPILVHRPTMRVIDGMHRLRARQLLGQETIEARFFDGSVEDAFMLAVAANVAHGLPLSLAERKAAAGRIVASHPDWSDRAIAKAAGLSGKTVGAIRRRATEEIPRLHGRFGRDGRRRPASTANGRRLASELIASRPGASLREIAAVAGVSPGTVRDVRARLDRGDSPIPVGRTREPRRRGQDLLATLQSLKRDPTLRFVDKGRKLLRWLDGHAIRPADRTALVGVVPDHCRSVVAQLARGYAEEWQLLASELEQRD